MNQFEAALQFYKSETPMILAQKRNEWASDPYSWCEVIRMTPIEAWFWGDIRNANVVMYPQYPVGRFFVDFANPVAKVAIECDGKTYHQDKAKDAARDAELRSMGWSVYRITGRECMTDFDEEEIEYGYARKFIEAIASLHGLKRGDSSCGKDGFECAMSVIDHILKMNPQ